MQEIPLNSSRCTTCQVSSLYATHLYLKSHLKPSRSLNIATQKLSCLVSVRKPANTPDPDEQAAMIFDGIWESLQAGRPKALQWLMDPEVSRVYTLKNLFKFQPFGE